MNIEMALKSRSYILDLDHVKLSLGIFFLLSCLIESIFHQLSGSTFIFFKNTPKSRKFNVVVNLNILVVKTSKEPSSLGKIHLFKSPLYTTISF